MREFFVDTPEALHEFCELISGSEWLALDTEFLREKTYYPKLCLLQISNSEVAACVDPLQIEDLKPLLDILFDGSILTIFHAARQDLEIFLHDWKQLPLPIFDTQAAAALLGHGDQIGYANLVKQVLKVDLAKDQSRTDWSARPLNEQQKRYALDDVIYLGQLYTEMRGRLSDRERLQWLAAEFSVLADPATYTPNPRVLWKKVKGKQHLRGRQLAVLQALAEWRELGARERNLPRKWLMKDDLMIELCRRLPDNINALGRIRGIEAGLIRREGENILKLIQQATKADRDEWPIDNDRPQPLSHQQEAMVDLLSASLRLIADQHQLSPQAIATHKDIEKLVRKENSILLEGWRHSVAGETLVAIKEGSKQLALTKGLLVIKNSNEQS